MFSTSCSECTILDRMIWRRSRGRAAQSPSCSASSSSANHRILGRAAPAVLRAPRRTVCWCGGQQDPPAPLLGSEQRSVRVSRVRVSQQLSPDCATARICTAGRPTRKPHLAAVALLPVLSVRRHSWLQSCSARRGRGEKVCRSGEKRSLQILPPISEAKLLWR